VPQNVWAIIKAVLRVNALDEPQVYFEDVLNNEERERETVSDSVINDEDTRLMGKFWDTHPSHYLPNLPTGSKSLTHFTSESKRNDGTVHDPDDIFGDIPDVKLERTTNRLSFGS